MDPKTTSEKLRSLILAACPDMPETDEGMFQLGYRWYRIAEPTAEEQGRRIGIKIVEVPTYAITFTINPNSSTGTQNG